MQKIGLRHIINGNATALKNVSLIFFPQQQKIMILILQLDAIREYVE